MVCVCAPMDCRRDLLGDSMYVMVMEGQSGNRREAKIQTSSELLVRASKINLNTNLHTQLRIQPPTRKMYWYFHFNWYVHKPIVLAYVYPPISMHTYRFAYWFRHPKIAPVMHSPTCCHYITNGTFPTYILYLHITHLGNKAQIITCHNFLQLVHFTPHFDRLYLSVLKKPVCGWLCLCIDRCVPLQFDMQQLSLDELKQVLFHAFRDHLTMKDIENIIITEEESLNETSGNCPEYEGGEEAALCWYKYLCLKQVILHCNTYDI